MRFQANIPNKTVSVFDAHSYTAHESPVNREKAETRENSVWTNEKHVCIEFPEPNINSTQLKLSSFILSVV